MVANVRTEGGTGGKVVMWVSRERGNKYSRAGRRADRWVHGWVGGWTGRQFGGQGGRRAGGDDCIMGMRRPPSGSGGGQGAQGARHCEALPAKPVAGSSSLQLCLQRDDPPFSSGGAQLPPSLGRSTCSRLKLPLPPASVAAAAAAAVAPWLYIYQNTACRGSPFGDHPLRLERY